MKTMKSLLVAATLVASMLSGTAALAHTDEYLDTQTTPHGGQLRMSGPLHLELVVVKDSAEVKENSVVVYVTDHGGNSIATEGATGSVTLLSGKTKVSITLAPDGENRLKGVGKYASTSDMKAVVSVTLSGKTAEQASFKPLDVQSKSHSMHEH